MSTSEIPTDKDSGLKLEKSLGKVFEQVKTEMEAKPDQAASQADSTASDVAGLVSDFNSLLAKLRASGVIEE